MSAALQENKKMETKKFSADIAGKTLSVETGLLAIQAHGSARVQYGDTVVLATATMSKDKREGMNFFPLSFWIS